MGLHGCCVLLFRFDPISGCPGHHPHPYLMPTPTFLHPRRYLPTTALPTPPAHHWCPYASDTLSPDHLPSSGLVTPPCTPRGDMNHSSSHTGNRSASPHPHTDLHIAEMPFSHASTSLSHALTIPPSRQHPLQSCSPSDALEVALQNPTAQAIQGEPLCIFPANFPRCASCDSCGTLHTQTCSLVPAGLSAGSVPAAGMQMVPRHRLETV